MDSQGSDSAHDLISQKKRFIFFCGRKNLIRISFSKTSSSDLASHQEDYVMFCFY